MPKEGRGELSNDLWFSWVKYLYLEASFVDARSNRMAKQIINTYSIKTAREYEGHTFVAKLIEWQFKNLF